MHGQRLDVSSNGSIVTEMNYYLIGAGGVSSQLGNGLANCSYCRRRNQCDFELVASTCTTAPIGAARALA